jgi:hypothetical protein
MKLKRMSLEKLWKRYPVNLVRKSFTRKGNNGIVSVINRQETV